jgi:hypothetical protein
MVKSGIIIFFLLFKKNTHGETRVYLRWGWRKKKGKVSNKANEKKKETN